MLGRYNSIDVQQVYEVFKNFKKIVKFFSFILQKIVD